MSFRILKASGEDEVFSEEKLRASLIRAGASDALAERVLQRVVSRADRGEISSESVFSQAYKQLKKEKAHVAARYSLKRAVMDLGPTGYPFERLVGWLLQAEGWDTQTGVKLEGSVFHEIDVVAVKPGRKLLVECKFRSDPGSKIDVKVAMYVSARARDLLGDLDKTQDEFYLVTNAKFTSDAFAFAGSVNLGLLAWDFPEGNGLGQRIQAAGLWPVTCLTTLKRSQKRLLLEEGIVLSRELRDQPELLVRIGVKGPKQRDTMQEIQDLIRPLSVPGAAT